MVFVLSPQYAPMEQALIQFVGFNKVALRGILSLIELTSGCRLLLMASVLSLQNPNGVQREEIMMQHVTCFVANK